MSRNRTVDLEDLADYEGTPYLSGLIRFATAIGTFIGLYAAIFLAGEWHRGLHVYWPMLFILAVDAAVNAGLRLLRWRRRRQLGLVRDVRRARNGLAPTSRRRARVGSRGADSGRL